MARLALVLTAFALLLAPSAEAKVCKGGRENEKTRVTMVSCARAKRVLQNFWYDEVAPRGWACVTARFESELGDRTRCRSGDQRITHTTHYAPD